MEVQNHKEKDMCTGCLICGKPILYNKKSTVSICHMCGKQYESNAVCTDGHYICDHCHASVQQDFQKLLPISSEKDPVRLFEQLAALPGVHMHGPEHHSIVPCIMLVAYRNNGGKIELDAALKTALQRGAQVPGGICGFWGACGAAIGAGIYASIVTGSDPLNARVWGLPQQLTARCLERMAHVGGPRCCKRTSRIAIEMAVRFTKEQFGIEIPLKASPCAYHALNKECLHNRCPYYGGSINAEI